MFSETTRLASGDLLIAPPRMRDPRFGKTVLLLTHLQDEAVYGLCLNKVTSHTVADLAPELDIDLPKDIPLYWGGPVNPQTIWMLHSSEWRVRSSLTLNQQWSMTSDIEMFSALAQGNRPRHYRFSFGFCAWTQSQLDNELQGLAPMTPESSWLTWKAPDIDRLMDVPPEGLWRVSCEQSSHQAVNSWLT